MRFRVLAVMLAGLVVWVVPSALAASRVRGGRDAIAFVPVEAVGAAGVAGSVPASGSFGVRVPSRKGIATVSDAGTSLKLSISRPRVEGGPITFVASGVAEPKYGGESADFVTGAVLRPGRKCPSGGADLYGNIRNTFAHTFHAFPVGSFRLTYRMRPVGVDPQALAAGRWRECAYLQSRADNSVIVAAERVFTVRRPHVRLALKRPLPRHIKLTRDSIGRSIGTAVFRVRAKVELSGRTLEVLVTPPGFHGPCQKVPGYSYSPFDGVRLKSGAARTYRVRVTLLFKPGPMPYGKRVRVCAAVHYENPIDDADLIEGSDQLPLVLRR